MAIHSIQSEAISRGARMLRTAFGPAIARFLEDPAIIEVMLNPDGRLWIDRLSSGLADTGEMVPQLPEHAPKCAFGGSVASAAGCLPSG